LDCIAALRPGARVAAEYLLYDDEDVSFSGGLRGMLSGLPGAAFSGGGPMVQLGIKLGAHVELTASATPRRRSWCSPRRSPSPAGARWRG
jgi:hypothetical protein